MAQLRGAGVPLVPENTRRSQLGGSVPQSTPVTQDHGSAWWDVAGPHTSPFLQFMLKNVQLWAHCLSASNGLCNGANCLFWVRYIPLDVARWEAPGGDTLFLQQHCFREKSIC